MNPYLLLHERSLKIFEYSPSNMKVFNPLSLYSMNNLTNITNSQHQQKSSTNLLQRLKSKDSLHEKEKELKEMKEVEPEHNFIKNFLINYLENKEIFNAFYGFVTNKEKSFNKMFSNENKLIDDKQRFKLYPSQRTKEEYLKLFHTVVNKSQNIFDKTYEFNFNYCLNITQTYALCPYCTIPNSMKDIRKGILNYINYINYIDNINNKAI